MKKNLVDLTKGEEMKRLVMYVVCGIVCGLFLMFAGVATATELVWVPINPSFGGPSYNATWLMVSATAQNKLKEGSNPGNPYTRDLIQDFESSLNRQILYRLSRKIIDAAFGEEGLESGYYNIGDYTIDVGSNLAGICIVVTDTGTGSTTTVEIPYY